MTLTVAAATAVCLGSGLGLAKPILKNHNVRKRPLFAVHRGEAFFGIADVSNALTLDYCAESQGAEQFFVVGPDESAGVDYTFAYVGPEVGGSCWMSHLPSGVKLIRVMGRCPDGVVELTSFDGTTITPAVGQDVLVGDPMVLPDGCEDVVAHEVIFEFELPQSESLPGPFPVGP